MVENIKYTPVEKIENIYMKRDDYYSVGNVLGGKVRSALELSKNAEIGLTTAGSRKSPQIQIISEIAKIKKLPFVAFTPTGNLTPELIFAKNNGAIINQVYMGFNNNIIKHAKDFSKKTGYTYIPFGMEDSRVLDKISEQVGNLPKDFKRLVISIGSGMTLCGIIRGFEKYRIDKPILGVVVGANPIKRLDTYASNWKNCTTLVKSNIDYHKEYKNFVYGGVELDPIYEAKCIDFLESGDLLWVVGKAIR